MNKMSSNGLNYILLDASSPYSVRTSIIEIIKTYFTPDIDNTWTIIDSINTLIKDGGTEEKIDTTAEGYQTLQCPWDKNFQITIGYFNSGEHGWGNEIYITFHDYSSGQDMFSRYSLMHNSMYTCKLRDPLYFNFIISKTKKSFAFSCSNDNNSSFMQFLCTTSEKNKMGVFLLPEINGMRTENETSFLYNGKRNPFSGNYDLNTFIYRIFPIINNKNTIILPCISDTTGDIFPEVYHLISTSVNEDIEIANAVFKINNSIYHGVVKQYGIQSSSDKYWLSGPFLLQIE